ncbi:hypothetical protein [Auraticoccus monumenti]|uniref:hypothetical protein n=1 Tax=Auraticoccus monumenti TaxID=675864 RepID=UPI0012F9C684|nr:hypothetical protein [Auraticoccus monumenti]
MSHDAVPSSAADALASAATAPGHGCRLNGLDAEPASPVSASGGAARAAARLINHPGATLR